VFIEIHLLNMVFFLVFPKLIWEPRWKTDPTKGVNCGFRRCEY